MVEQPTGTVTMVFTDIEGSTRLLEELGTDAYRDALAEHRRIVRAACARFDGYEVDYEGDAFFYAFSTAQAAVNAVTEAMQELDAGPIRVRVGIHTGEPALDPPKYVGLDVHRSARIMSAAHGGQVVLSRSTVALLEPGSVELKELGQHRLKDLTAPVPLHQLVTNGSSTEFPPLKTLYRTNLPVPASPFIGREKELAEVMGRLLDRDTRLLTLTGPGGTGKTRLALQAAAEAADRFPDGITWVPLAPLRDPSLVLPGIAQTLEIREHPGQAPSDAIASALGGKQVLLLLDNAEHLLPELANDLAALLGACPTLRLLVTSRERIQIGGEESWPVPTLAANEGEALFVERARAAGVELDVDDTIRELCHRLDQLPLALELAAARTPLFSAEGLLERVGSRLDLLRGRRDGDPRQATLRTTIDWSYELLDEAEMRLFEAVAVFVDGCLYDAAQEVADADPDTLQSLIDKSLLRRRDSALGPRYWMLETIREYASERLSESGIDERVAERHAAYYAEFFPPLAQQMRNMDVAVLTRADHEAANIRRGVDFALRSRRADLASLYFYGLWPWMVVRGALPEASGHIRTYLELDLESVDPQTRFAGYFGVAEMIRHLGGREEAIRLKRRMLEDLPAVSDRPFYGRDLKSVEPALLTDLAHLELDIGELGAAESHARQALAIRERDGHPWGIAHALNAGVAIAAARGDFLEARVLQERVVTLMRDSQLIPVETVQEELGLAELELLCAELSVARQQLAAVDVAEIVRVGDLPAAAEALRIFAMCMASSGALEEATFLIGAYGRLHREIGISTLVQVTARVEALVGDLRRQLGEERFDRIAATGAASPAMELVSELPARLRGS